MKTASKSIHEALITAFYKTKKEEVPALLHDKLNQIFSSKENFIKKTKALDLGIAEFKIPADTGELIFDLLLFNFFSEDSRRLGEDFFESKEWEQIEDAIMDRGTELMNILLYLQECRDSGIEYSIDDYLDEYLIGDDDFDNEEHEVYEAVIKNRETINDGNPEAMVEICNKNPDSPLGDQLLPILLFFESSSSTGRKEEILLKNGSNPPFQISFLTVLSSF